MSDILEEVKKRLLCDFGNPEHEWQALLNLLERAGTHTSAVLRWIFAEYKGYTKTRARAGLEFVKGNPIEGWLILEHLIASDDPDDRDTALTVLVMSGDSRAPQLAKALLKDTWPYLQFDAADFLKEIYPTEVNAALQSLLHHDEEWVRDEARRRLAKMGERYVTD